MSAQNPVPVLAIVDPHEVLRGAHLEEFIELARMAKARGGELMLRRAPKNGPFVYIVNVRGGPRELPNLAAVRVELKDFS